MTSRRVVWLVLVLAGLSPLLALILPDALAAPLHAWFGLQCERDAARTFALFEQPLPVCARCLGIYLALGAGAPAGAAAARFCGVRLTGRRLVAATLAAATVLLLDVATESLGLRPALAALRFGTGFALAFPVATALGAALGG